MAMAIKMQHSEFQMVEVENKEPGKPYVKLEEETYRTLENFSTRSEIEISYLASQMIEFAMKNAVFIDKDGNKTD